MQRGNGPMRADDTALVSFFHACVLAGGTSIWPRTFSDAGDHPKLLPAGENLIPPLHLPSLQETPHRGAREGVTSGWRSFGTICRPATGEGRLSPRGRLPADYHGPAL